MFDEDPNASLSGGQLKLLRGRKLEELSPSEKLAFANLRPIAKPADGNNVPPAIAFRVDPDKVDGLSAHEKLSIANGAAQLVKLRKRIIERQAELERSDEYGSRIVAQELAQLQREAGKLYREIAPYERKPEPEVV